ncbi:hypothetical protein F3Y22_tig00110940pilonHSYRG00544 [Hibiscus syriacus]|uniref:Cation/H+ exchanger transmembrane domain-containing protein n=1 Tax=Hibiscus syriacus TaxID=106335 RepID=A0A6A2ZCT8_HIBSY|nr:hypothetical protein F3Y22_tig00110940pilonHSYRG00544 [Hibiscus syriacus]
MEPDYIRLFGSMPRTLLTKNPSLVCSNFCGLSHASIFDNSSPFTFMLPLLMLQLAFASAAILLTFSLLRRLGVPLMFAQILGGIQVGPSMLSMIPGFPNTIFPIRMPMILTMATALVWMQFEDPIDKRINRLLEIAKAESMVSYSMVTYYISELRVINSEVGRVAVCSSMVSTLCSLCVITSNLLWTHSEDDVLLFFELICCIVIFATLVCCTLGPILLWEMKQTLGGQPLKQGNLVVLFVAVLMSGFWARSFGLDIYFGPYLFGLLIPSGPPLGSALVEKLDVINNWMLLPIFFVKFGLPLDIFAIRFKIYFKVQFYSLLGAFGKFLGASLSAVSCQVPQRDAISLGFFMTFQGIFELVLYKLMKRKGSRPNSRLRVLVCIHEEQNVPSAINLLATLSPGKQSPIVVYMLHMIEIIGAASPLLISHRKTRRVSPKTRGSGPVINAFKNFEETHAGLVSVSPFI